jgi:hypothetical protein
MRAENEEHVLGDRINGKEPKEKYICGAFLRQK